MHRVVSASKTTREYGMENENSSVPPSTAETPSGGANIIEPEEVSDAPMQLVGQTNETMSSSSLSDESEDRQKFLEGKSQAMETDDQDQHLKPASPSVGLRRNNNFQRMDSTNDSSSGSQRASSQNSSRDWGWFEDVHQSSEHLPLDKKSPRKASATKRQGLVPQVEDKLKEIIIKPGQGKLC